MSAEWADIIAGVESIRLEDLERNEETERESEDNDTIRPDSPRSDCTITAPMQEEPSPYAKHRASERRMMTDLTMSTSDSMAGFTKSGNDESLVQRAEVTVAGDLSFMVMSLNGKKGVPCVSLTFVPSNNKDAAAKAEKELEAVLDLTVSNPGNIGILLKSIGEATAERFETKRWWSLYGQKSREDVSTRAIVDGVENTAESFIRTLEAWTAAALQFAITKAKSSKNVQWVALRNGPAMLFGEGEVRIPNSSITEFLEHQVDALFCDLEEHTHVQSGLPSTLSQASFIGKCRPCTPMVMAGEATIIDSATGRQVSRLFIRSSAWKFDGHEIGYGKGWTKPKAVLCLSTKGWAATRKSVNRYRTVLMSSHKLIEKGQTLIQEYLAHDPNLPASFLSGQNEDGIRHYDLHLAALVQRSISKDETLSKLHLTAEPVPFATLIDAAGEKISIRHTRQEPILAHNHELLGDDWTHRKSRIFKTLKGEAEKDEGKVPSDRLQSESVWQRRHEQEASVQLTGEPPVAAEVSLPGSSRGGSGNDVQDGSGNTVVRRAGK